MNTAYFVKTSENLSWNTLKEKIRLQQEADCRPLPFVISDKVCVSSQEFDSIAKNLGKPHSCYASNAAQSLPDSHGVWHCILIEAPENSRNLLLYTAGRSWPLYASILTASCCGSR